MPESPLKLNNCSRGHNYEGPGGCPVCWAANKKDGAKAKTQATGTGRASSTRPRSKAKGAKQTDMAAEKTGQRARYD
jgi:hypothetical protein